MTNHRCLLLTSLVLCGSLLVACGTTETDTTPIDAAADATSDATADLGTDGADTATDTGDRDSETDTTTDSETDTGDRDTETDTTTDTGPDGDELDVTDPDSSDGGADTPTDTPLDTPTDTPTDATPCTDGDSRTDGCETCTCFAGEWSCNTDEWCATEECLHECGVGCPAPEFQPCGDDLNLYCSTCQMDCYGVTEIDREACDDPASTCGPPPPDATPVEYELWTGTDDCRPSEFDFGDFAEERFFASEEDFAAEYSCAGSSGIDWDTARVARVAYSERPDAELLGVWDRGETLLVGLGAPVYCGGAAPPSSTFHVLVDADGPEGLMTSLCSWGRCTGPPRP